MSLLMRTRRSSATVLLLLGSIVLALSALPATTYAAAVREAWVELRLAGQPFPGASLVVLPPGDESRLVHLDGIEAGRTLLGPFPSGDARLELRDGDGRQLRSWPLLLAAGLGTRVVIDASEGTMTTSRFHPDPFGQAALLRSDDPVTHLGAGADLLAGSDPAVRRFAPGAGPSGSRSRLRPATGGTRGGTTGEQLWLGTPPPGLSMAPGRFLAPGLRENEAFVQGGTGSPAHLEGMAAGRARGEVPFLGTVDAQGSLHGGSADQGFALAGDDDPGHNALESIEASLDGLVRPGGFGLARVHFHAAGQSREHYLHEFRRNTQHSPREDRGTLTGSIDWDLPLKPLDLTLGVGYQRQYIETGDGRAFDRVTNYHIGSSDNEWATTNDRLYWWGGARDSSRPAHLYNYYMQDLATALTLRTEVRPERSNPYGLKAGVEAELARWRWYEHLDPIADAATDPEGLGGFQYASYLGYSRDGQDRAELAGQESPRPVTLRAYLSRGLTAGPARFAAGLRWIAFAPDQRAIRNFTDPLGADSKLSDDDFVDVDDRTWVEPSLGAYLELGPGLHLWVDGGRQGALPPYEALYLSPNRLVNQASLAQAGPLSYARETIFGNAALEPEQTIALRAGLLRAEGERWSLRLAGSFARTEETWVATAHEAGADTLFRYGNRGERREGSLRLDLEARPSPGMAVRASYALGRAETNVIEPAPLYRGLILPDLPVEGTGTNETFPVSPLWCDDGLDRDWFPSLLDRTHRFALAWTAQLGADPGAGVPGALRRVQLSARATAISGAPYTPTYTRAEGLMLEDEATYGPALEAGSPLDPNGNGALDAEEINSARAPWTWQIDLGASRPFRLFGQRLRALVDVRNLLDRKNPLLVYGATGEADDDGWLDSAEGQAYLQTLGTGAESFSSAYRERIDNPNRYGEGRRVRFALSWEY